MNLRKIAGGVCALGLLVMSLAGQGEAAVRPADQSPARAASVTASALLPNGYLSTKGSQIVDSTGKPVRIAAVALHGLLNRDQFTIVNQDQPLPGLAANMQAIRDAGFNTVTLAWNNASLHTSNASQYLASLDAVVNAAKARLLKVILVHHSDEGQAGTNNCNAQQSNGLWYDSGPGTNNTDGCGTPGTVTQESFLADWSLLASRYSGNSTVIGMDLDNEPLAYPGDSTWGDGDVRDIQKMYTTVGNAVESRDPGVLIICEGPQNYVGSFAGGAGVNAFEGDLTMVRTKPVVLSSANGGSARVVYSVHSYPFEVAHVDPDAGAAAVARWNAIFGYLVKENLHPVYIGEAGAGMTSQDSQLWATWLTEYVNGQLGANGGPTFTGTQQGISVTWWVWDTMGLGTLNSDGTLNQARKSVYSKWQLDVTP